MQQQQQVVRYVPSATQPGVVYTVDAANHFCTCPGFKYQARPVAARTCKHLPVAPSGGFGPPRRRSSSSSSSSSRLRVPLVGQTPGPRVFRRQVGQYLVSRKYDGVFAKLDAAGVLTTRGGQRYVVPAAMVPDPWPEEAAALDVEVCPADAEATEYTHYDVMRSLNRGQAVGLHFKVIDYDPRDRPGLPFHARYAHLDRALRGTTRAVSLVRRTRVPAGTAWQDALRDLAEVCRQEGYEGVVFQDRGAAYTPGERSSVRSFKWKPTGGGGRGGRRMKTLSSRV